MEEPLMPPSPSNPPLRPWWKLRFSPPNPFYLLSAASFLHATGVWAQQQGRELPDVVRMSLIGSYLLLMTLTVLVIVRLWNHWDDARSILLTILLLFAELALTFDDALMRDPRQGALLLGGGLALSIVVSEILFRGLRMRFPARFRVPFSLQLALVFLFPLLLVGPARAGDRTALTERLFGFSWLAAGSFLLLIPAIRLRNKGLEDTGTPWTWPLYPWPAFVFLGICLLARTFAQCLSFDSMSMLDLPTAINGLPSIFGPHFLAPFVLAMGVLLYVAAISSNRPRQRAIALTAFPATAFLMSFPGDSNAASQQFLALLTERWCAPPALMLIAAAAFLALAAIRGDRLAGSSLAAVLGLASVVTPDTIHLTQMFRTPHPWPIAILAAWSLWAALQRRSSVWFALTTTLATWLAWRLKILEAVDLPDALVACHLMLIGLLTSGFLFDDRWAIVWRRSTAVLIVGFAVIAAVDFGLPATTLLYIASLMILAAAVAWWKRDLAYANVSLITAMLLELDALRLSYEQVNLRTQWGGLSSFALALALLLMGFHVSAWKAGVLQRARAAILNQPSE
jgi:hypothetical protein